jgi:hypothetical protein
LSGAFTYNELVAALQSWQAEDVAAFVAEIPRFIEQAELRTLRDLNLTIFDSYETGLTTVASQREVDKPAGWFITRDLYIVTGNDRTRLEEKSLSYCMAYAPTPTVEDTPELVCELSSTQWYVVPTPDAVIGVEALVGIRPTGLSSGQQSTWLGSNCGDLLHAQAMKGAALYLKQAGKDELWESHYERHLTTARLELRHLIRSDYHPVKPAARAI